MPDIERGRLCSIGMDGSDSVPYIIKKDCILFGSGDSCEIRIYVDGVAPEHCLITFDEEGKAFLEPVNKYGLTFLNGEVIDEEMILNHKDVITIVKRSFRFFYPSSSRYSSKRISHSEENTVTDHLDFDEGVGFIKSKEEAFEKRVTFGPRLSPEEFDKNMPPASPLRRGSLPCENLKKTPPVSPNMPVIRNLFENIQATENAKLEATSKHKLSKSTVVLQKLRSEYECHESEQEFESRPLFSEILKKQIANPNKTIFVDKKLQKLSGRRLPKKTLRFQNSKRSIFKSPRTRIHPRLLAVGSTGHANSPETIVIYKKKFSSVATDGRSRRLSKVQPESSRHSTLDSGSDVDATNKECSDNIENSVAHHACYCCQEGYQDFETNVQRACSKRFNSLMPAICGTLFSNERHKRFSKRDDDINGKKKETTKKESASLLAGTFGDVHRLGGHSIEKSLKDISNAVQALSSHAGVSSCMNNAFSSPDICVDVVKKLALTISMVNAFHTYNKIINDISSFPLCFPSTSFQAADSTKCIQKSSVHQNEEKMDFQQLAWFHDIMQNFFANSLNNIACDAGDQCALRSCENALNSEMSSSPLCHKKRRKSRSTSKKSTLKAADSGYTGKASRNQLMCYETSAMNNNNRERNVAKEDDDVHSKRCSVCKVKSPTFVEKCRHPSTTDEANVIFLPDTCLSHSISHRKNCCSVQYASCDQSLCSHALDLEETSQVNSRKRSSFDKNSEKQIKNIRQSFEGFTEKHKCMLLKKKSLSLSSLKRGTRLENILKHTSIDNPTIKTLGMSLNRRSLRSKANATLKAKERKASLIIQKYAAVSLKKIQEKRNERKSSLLKNSSANFDVTLRSTKRKKAEATLQKLKRMKTDQKSPRMPSKENTPFSVYENQKASRLSQSPKDSTTKSVRGMHKRKIKKSISSNAEKIKINGKATRSCRKRKSVLLDKIATAPKMSTPKNVRGSKREQISKSRNKSPVKKDFKKEENAEDSIVRSRKRKSSNLKDELMADVRSKTRTAVKKTEDKVLSVKKVVKINKKKKGNSSNVSFFTEEMPMKSSAQTRKEASKVHQKDANMHLLTPASKTYRGRRRKKSESESADLSSQGDSSPVQRQVKPLRGKRTNQKITESCTIPVKTKSQGSKKKNTGTNTTNKKSKKLSKINGDSSPAQRKNSPLREKRTNQKITRSCTTARKSSSSKSTKKTNRTRTTANKDLDAIKFSEFNDVEQKKSETQPKRNRVLQMTSDGTTESTKKVSNKIKGNTANSAVKNKKPSELVALKTAKGKSKKLRNKETNISPKKLRAKQVTHSRQSAKRRKV